MVKVQTILLSLMLAVGLTAGIGGYYGTGFIDDQLDQGINDLLVLPKPGDEGYEDFLTNEEEGDLPTFRKYYFWNLTNAEEYLSGATPEFEEIGPYTYQQFNRKINVNYNSDFSEITYQTYTYYKFNQSESFAGASLDDVIVNINPAYLGVLAGAGSELALVTSFVGPAIQSVVAGLEGDFTQGVVAQGDAAAMNTIVSGLTGDFTDGVVVQGQATAMDTIVIGLTSSFTDGVIAQGDAIALNTIVDGLTGSFTDGVLAQGNALALEGIENEAVENFEFAVNATTAANVVAQSYSGVVGATSVAIARDALFNSTTFQDDFGTPIEGVSEWATGGLLSLGFSDFAVSMFLDGNQTNLSPGLPDIPGLLEDLATGTGALTYLGLYDSAINNDGLTNSTLQAVFNATQTQLDAYAGYLNNYLIEDNAVVAGAYATNNGGQTTQQAAFTNLYAQWVNASFVPEGLDINGDDLDDDGFELSLSLDYGIDNDTVAALFDSSNAFALTNDTVGISTWLQAAQGNTTLQATLLGAFPAINATELTAIFVWLGEFYADSGLGTQLALASIAGSAGYTPGTVTAGDLGFLHWANSKAVGITLNLLDPSVPTAPEYWAVTGTNMSLANAKALLSNPTLNLTTTDGAGFFYIEGQKAAAGNTTALAVLNGAFGTTLTQVEVLALLGYLTNPITNVFVLGSIAEATGNSFGTFTTADLGYLHWGNPGVTGGLNLTALDDSLPTAPEYWAVTGSNMSLANSKALLSNPTLNLTSTDGVGFFLIEGQKAAAGNATALAVLNGAFSTNLTQGEVTALLGYLSTPIYNVFVLGAIAEATGEAYGSFGTADLGYLHWANSGVTGGITLNILDPSLPAAPEYWPSSGTSMSLANAKALLSNSALNLTTTNGIGFFLLEGQKAAAGNATALAAINDAFSTTLTQAEVVNLLTYLSDPITDVFVLGEIAVATGETPGSLEVADIGYLHWANDGVTGGITLDVLSPDAGLAGPPELWANAGVDFTLANARALLTNESGTLSLRTTDGVGYLLQNAAGLSADPSAVTTAVNTAFGASLTPTELGLVAQYITYLQQVFIVEATLEPLVFALGGGLITDRTINEWLFENSDPFLEFLIANGQDLDSTNAGLFTNATDVDDPRIAEASTINTGQTNLEDLLQYVEWQGNDSITVWESNEPITGTDATQFAPGVSSTDRLQAYVSDLLRVVDFVYSEDVEVKGIDLLKFVLADSALGVDSNYYQSIRGIANMSKAAGIPLFLSKPHFLDGADSLTAAVSGLDADRDLHDTYLGVEPTSGAVFDARKRLQVSFNIEAGNFIYKDLPSAYMPIVWIEDGGTIPDDSAEAFVDSVYGAFQLRELLGLGGIGFGAMLSVVSLSLLMRPKFS